MTWRVSMWTLLMKTGLRLTGLSDFTATVHARTEVSEIPECEFGIIATKTMFTRSAMESVAPIFRDGAVCSVQNGIGNEEIVAEYAPRVIQGTIFPAGHITAPGVVNHDAGGKTWIGPFATNPATMDEVEQLADALNRSGMECLAMEDARGAQWTKLIFNSASNAMGALTRLPHGVACDQEGVRKVMSVLVSEGMAVADALGITLDSDPEALIDYGREKAYYHPAQHAAGRDGGKIDRGGRPERRHRPAGPGTGHPVPHERGVRRHN